jgi:branched-subunit amino acid transport protein AzlD
VALAVALLVWFVGLFALRGFRFPVGPDVPVYLWWTRLSGVEGLSTVERPGTMALLGVLRWIGVGLPAAVAGVECALGASVGLGAAALARARRGSRVVWVLAGALAGTFATHLAAGYVSNLVFAVPFIAVLVVLGDASRRSTVAAAIVLGAAALAHPLFFVVGAGVLLVAGALAFGSARDETWRAVAASAGGAAILGLGFLSMLAGPSILRVDTSQDAFLRRAGLGDTLAHAYRDRLIHRWTRYVQWASVPLALFAARRPEGWVRRALWAWFAVTALGVLVGMATTWFPPDRFLTFGYAIPILAAFGVVALVERWRRRRRLAIAVASALTVAMIAGAGIAWLREKPYLGTDAVADVVLASRYAATSPPGTPWIFPINSPSSRISFLATRVQNVIRASVPPDRIRDVYVVAPSPAVGISTDDRREWAALARLYASDAARAARDRPAPVVIDITAFHARLRPRPDVCDPPVCAALAAPRRTIGDGVSVSADVASAAARPMDTTLATSTIRIVAAGPLVLLVLFLAGFGWSGFVVRDRTHALALAPAFGTAAIVLGGVVADRLGLRLSSAAHGLLVLTLVTIAGYGVFLAERRRRPHPAP